VIAATLLVYRQLEIDPANLEAAPNLAWLFAPHPDLSVRNGRKAVALAERAHPPGAKINQSPP